MTYQEVLWLNKRVQLIKSRGKSGKEHSLKNYIGLSGVVLKESKNGQLLVYFELSSLFNVVAEGRIRAIPASCVVECC